MPTEKFTNQAQSSLNGAINGITTSVVLVDASKFPSAGNFRIVCESEIMLVTAVSGNTLTVIRGYEGTSAASHNSGTGVSHVITAGALDQFRIENLNSGTVAGTPAAEKAGRLYYTTNSSYIYRDNGTAQIPWGPAFQMTEPVLGSFTWVNQGGATAVSTNGGIYMQKTGASSAENHSFMVQSVAAPYTLVAGYSTIANMTNPYGLTGVYLYNSGSGKNIMVRFGGCDNYTKSLFIQQFNTVGGTNSVTFGSNANANWYHGMGGMYWVKITDDNTTRRYYIGSDPNHFMQFASEASGTFLTADKIGFGVNAFNADTGIWLQHWSLT